MPTQSRQSRRRVEPRAAYDMPVEGQLRAGRVGYTRQQQALLPKCASGREQGPVCRVRAFALPEEFA